ncbi:hypothetical protein Nepgr_014186 [Nepenthes gracilis]|uniref:X8 domain-containing protein n=1 Tax=Nepenthes gracilis TaxID=150966 RepID=A0AAD3XQ65_NEPGR|nr:hypothetical protein Nepgr_014186 [Nepenthes gracilis]
MKGLLNHLHRRSVAPLRRQDSLKEVYILCLLDEDQRSLASGGFERHWGLFTFNGQAEYHVHLLGKGSRKSLRNSQNVDYLSTRWCVVNNSKNDLGNSMVSALEACSADCSALLSPGGSCFNLSWPVNVSYAFNCYYQQHDQSADGCDFGGLGLITTVDPSVDRCRFFCSDSNFLCCVPSGVVFDLLCCFDSRISLRIFVHCKYRIDECTICFNDPVLFTSSLFICSVNHRYAVG